MTEQERIEINRRFIKRGIEFLINKIFKTEVPEKGNFVPKCICYYEPVSQNDVRMTVIADEREVENSRRLVLSVTVGDSGYRVENFVKKGSNSEIIEYLQQEDTPEIFFERIMTLNKKAEEKKGEYPFN